MVKSIGAEGYVGVAFETTAGTYAAPTKFFPIRSESLSWTQATNWRRVIRGTADVIGAVAGNGNVEGDIDMELLSDVLPYFLRCARGTVVKTALPAGAGPYTHYQYDFTPAHNAVPPKTMSVTVVRAGVAFGYTGCVVSSMTFGTDNDMGTMAFTLLGTAEQNVAVPAAPAYGADEPFGSGQWSIQIPTATQVFDVDSFSFEVNDNASAQNRLKNSLGAQFVAFGERDVTVSADRDFESRTEYDAFKALTARSVTIQAIDTAQNSVTLTTPVAFADSYEVGLGGVGDLVRASVSYVGTHDAATGGAYEIQAVTTENITL